MSLATDEPIQQIKKQQKHVTNPVRYQSIMPSFSNKKLLWLGCGLVLLLIIPLLVLLLSANKVHKTITNTHTTPIIHTKKSTTQKQQSEVLVYGTWTSQSSVIRATDLTTKNTKTLATLPLSIKKISILSNDSLLYIDQTNQKDQGQRISVYNIKEKQIITNIPAAQGYGIDDYVLSPDKKYLALWEVQLAPDTQTVQGGQARVYAVNLTQPSIVNLLYDESITQTIPIHHPQAISDEGTVYTDQFIPTDTKGGTGWAYGMSRVDFDGTNKQDIASMTNGTYSSQPKLSPDGDYLLFVGYDGKNGEGTEIKNGYRQALLTSNTVELLNIQTLKRYKLPNLPDTDTYSNVQWDQQTGNIILSILSPDATKIGVFLYDLAKLQTEQISLPLANGTPYGYVSKLPGNKTLIGLQSTDAPNLGNLGETYTYAYTQLAILDTNSKLSYLAVIDPFIQYITVLPGNFFNTL